MRYELGDSRTATELGIRDVEPGQVYFYVECMVAGPYDAQTGLTEYKPVQGWVTLDGSTGILNTDFFHTQIAA